MFIHYQTKGFVIKRINRGEADQVFTVYTQDFGKLKLLAKAVRKIKSKLRGGLGLFTLAQIEFIQGKTHKTLTDAVTTEKFDKISKSLTRLKAAYKIAEVLDNLIRGEGKDKSILDLLNKTLRELNNLSILPRSSRLARSSSEVGSLLLYYYFFWNLIDLIGYRPSVYNCSFCQKRIVSEPLYLNSEQGGVICGNCFKKLKSGRKIDADLVKILRIILKKKWQTLCRIKINPLYYQAFKNISDDYYSHLLKELR